MKGITSDGYEFEVLPLGTKVCHKLHPELIGRIVTHEHHSLGKYSALPYTVAWDNNDLAHDLLGILPIWPDPKNIEEATDAQS